MICFGMMYDRHDENISNTGVCVSFKQAKKSRRLSVKSVQGEDGRDCSGETSTLLMVLCYHSWTANSMPRQ